MSKVPLTSYPSAQRQQGAHAPVCQSALSAGHQALASSSGLHRVSAQPWKPSWVAETKLLIFRCNILAVLSIHLIFAMHISSLRTVQTVRL